MVAAVGPRVVRAALDQYVARLHQGLSDIHQRPDLALDDDGIVDTVGLVEAGMAGGRIVGLRRAYW